MPNRWARGVRVWASCAALVCALSGDAARAGFEGCEGDCDLDALVSVSDVITAVNVGLELAPTTACPAFYYDNPDPNFMDDLMRAVNNALVGCPPPTVTTAGLVFNGEGNRLNVYEPGPGFFKQTLIPSAADVPGGEGRDLNAQICFTRGPAGQIRFIGGEDTNQGGGHNSAGWGFFELSGAVQIGLLDFNQIGKLIPTYQTTADGAENYGCGFLSDGRLVTTDVGNQASGLGNGQLIMWFPPFDGGVEYTETGVFPLTPVRYCKLDIAIGTAQQIAVDAQDRIYVGSARDNGLGVGAGVYRYTGPFPTSDTPAGGCDGTDATGAPMVTQVTKERFIPSSANIPTPNGAVIKPDGGFYVSSVLNGVIAEFDANGQFVRKVLQPSAPGFPIPTGSPLGFALASDGTIYFADVGLVIGPGGIGPGNRTGTVRRVRFVDGQPQPPETLDTGLSFPDGIGVLELPPPTATPDSEEERTRRPTSTLGPTRTPLPAP